MSREVRKVPADWKHPKVRVNDSKVEQYQPMFSTSFKVALEEWLADLLRIRSGGMTENEKRYYPDGLRDWIVDNPTPNPDYYMPDFPEGSCTHYMMYETTTEGTPISPAFATPEKLARWLADTKASAFAGETASYEAWLRVAKGGYAPSLVITSEGLQSGVEALS